MDAAVKQLLALKAEYKQITGQDYKPGPAPAKAALAQKAPAPVKSSPAPVKSSPAPAPAGLYEQVAEQGEMVRKLKTEKAPKVRPQIQILPEFPALSLNIVVESCSCSCCCHHWMVLFLLAVHQDQVDAAVKQLLALKAEYKQQTGQDYKPGQVPSSPAQTQSKSSTAQSSSSPQAQKLFSEVAQQGELVRKLKCEKAPKVRDQSQSGIKYC